MKILYPHFWGMKSFNFMKFIMLFHCLVEEFDFGTQILVYF